MKFNTVILYDIENLIGGYNNDMPTNLSLKDIFHEIKSKDIGKIAIQRAYANWSDSRLGFLRGDIVELGIEPIQMFGFGRGSQKNACDIQLAIDAVDIAFTKNTIEVFIIVSGDGGFSSLAKKLHEYGKTVIGCAYRRAANKVFEAVSDDFIWIEDPKEESIASHVKTNGIVLNNDPIIYSFTKKFHPIYNPSKEMVIKASNEVFNFLAESKDAIGLLSNTGLNISVLSQLLEYRINEFNYFKLGFIKFIDFIRFASFNTPCKLVFKAPSEYRIVLNHIKLQGYEEVDYITHLGEIHTLENYVKFLERGSPAFKQFNREKLIKICDYLSENKSDFQNIYFLDIIDRLDNIYDLEQSEIKGTIMSLTAAECFLREPDNAKISEQKMYFIPQSSQQALMLIEQGMRLKLQSVFENLDESIFSKILN